MDSAAHSHERLSQERGALASANGPRFCCRCVRSPARYRHTFGVHQLRCSVRVVRRRRRGVEGPRQRRRLAGSQTRGSRDGSGRVAQWLRRSRRWLARVTRSWADKGLNQERSGGDDTLIGGQGCGALDGLDALVDDVDVAHMMGAEEALEGGAARELDGFEGRPLGEEVAEDGGVFVVKPLEDVGEVVFQGTGEAIGETHVVADQTAAMFDEWLKGTHRGAWGVRG